MDINDHRDHAEETANRAELETPEDDAVMDLADRIEPALENADRDGLTPSAAARRVGVPTGEARAALAWMVAHRFAHTTGNGAWARYHAGRA